MMVVAIVVFSIVYLLIATERINRVVAALAGAGVILAVGVVGSDDAFFSKNTGIDWNVIFLLFGMMVIVGVLRQTGVFEYVAIWAAKRAKGRPREESEEGESEAGEEKLSRQVGGACADDAGQVHRGPHRPGRRGTEDE